MGPKFENLFKKLKLDETFTTKPNKTKKFDTVKQNAFPKNGYNFMADLLFLPETNEKFKYLLVVVDIWSNAFDIEPLKDKTAENVLLGYKNIIKRPFLNLAKASIKTDNGTEFKSVFAEFLKTNNILHRVTRPNRHQQNANVESLNKQLGRIFMTYLTNKEQEFKKPYNEWMDIIDLVRKELNKVRIIPDGNPFSLEPIPYTQQIPKYKIGDIVMAKLEVPNDGLGNKQNTSNFRMGDVRWDVNNKLKIIKIFNYPNNIRYMLNTMPNVSFTENELKLSKPEIQEETFEVKKILDKKIVKNKTYYLIWWKRYKKKEATWESLENLVKDGLEDEIDDFNKN